MLERNVDLAETLVSGQIHRSHRRASHNDQYYRRRVMLFCLLAGSGLLLLVGFLPFARRRHEPYLAVQEPAVAMASQFPPQLSRAQLQRGWQMRQAARGRPSNFVWRHSASIRAPVAAARSYERSSGDVSVEIKEESKSEKIMDADFVLDRVYGTVFGGEEPPKELAIDSMAQPKASRTVSSLRLRTTDGAFAVVEMDIFDDANAPRGIYYYGYDGEKAWRFEEKQRAELELDEKDAEVLGMWSRYALFALPQIRRKLSCETLSPGAAAEMGAQEGETCLSLRLSGESDSSHLAGFLTTYQFVDTKTWLPTRFLTDYGGGRKSIELSDWAPGHSVPSMLFPTSALLVDRNGGESNMKVYAVRLQPHVDPVRPSATRDLTLQAVLGEDIPEEVSADMRDDFTQKPIAFDSGSEPPYEGPQSEYGYSDTIFDATKNKKVALRRSIAGQLLIPATINGQDVGHFLLDSGCSTNVMSRTALEKLKLSKFAEVNASVLGGVSSAAYAEVDKLTVGPMTITDQVFVVMDLGRDFAIGGPVVAGILGYDFFIRATIEIQDYGTKSCSALIYDPRQAIEFDELEHWNKLSYAPLKFLLKIPHLEAVIKPDCESQTCRNLMFLDTGAGSYLQLNGKKAKSLGVTASDKAMVWSHTGVGGGGSDLESKESTIEYLGIEGTQLNQSRVEVRLVDGDIDLSNRGNGVVGMKFFEMCRFVIDYPNRQIGVARSKETARPSIWTNLMKSMR